jgi:bifunctional UDP-N-acetylglucosamine 2-epimerase / N-acetylmannosamine kinase
MAQKRKICIVITARPSYSRIKTAIRAIQKHHALELKIVVAGSALLDRYGNVINSIEKDGFNIDERVYMVLEGENPTTMSKTTGIGILELSNIFYNMKPDIVITIADRFETLGTAISAAYQNIPLAHIQGGEVTGNIDEKVRHSITKLADIHFVATEKARERVIKMGEDPEYIFNTGCPSIDLAAEILNSPELDFDIYEKYGGVGAKSDYKNGYLVVLQHPVTNEYKEARMHITETLKAIAELHTPTMWFWPNVDAGADGTSKGIRAFREIYAPNNIHFFKNMSPEDFLKLIYNSNCLIGNSSVGIRESSFLGVPVVNIGSRQYRRERGQNVLDVDYSSPNIKNAIIKQLANGRYSSDETYGKADAGEKIAEILSTIQLRSHKTITY